MMVPWEPLLNRIEEEHTSELSHPYLKQERLYSNGPDPWMRRKQQHAQWHTAPARTLTRGDPGPDSVTGLEPKWSSSHNEAWRKGLWGFEKLVATISEVQGITLEHPLTPRCFCLPSWFPHPEWPQKGQQEGGLPAAAVTSAGEEMPSFLLILFQLRTLSNRFSKKWNLHILRIHKTIEAKYFHLKIDKTCFQEMA